MKGMKQKILSLLGLAILLVSFQNFKKVTVSPWKMKSSDEDIRIEHAKELLGKYFGKNPVSMTEGLPYLEVHMANHLQANLPKEFKKDAGKIMNAILEQSEKYEMDPVFVLAIVATESRYNPKAIGGVGEIGLMQIRPETAEWIAKKEKIKWQGKKTLYDPVSNIKIGVAYVSFLRDHFDGKAMKYLSAYNMGPGKLKKMLGLDQKPKVYSTTVMKNYKKIYESIASFKQLKHIASIDNASL